MDFETRAIHVGQEPDPATGAVTTPIYQTSTYAQEAVGVNKGYDYARVGNPTRTALEECLASLENAAFGLAFSSGLGAATTIMHLVDPGQRLVCVNDVYGGMYRMFSQVYEPKGYDFDYITPDEVSTNLAAHLDERTRIVWVESPTNPLLNIVDIRAAADAAHAAGALLVVDNTFATPYLQQPLELGADIVVHSTTKYLGGHSDVIGGFAATNDPTIAERLRFLQKSLGAVPGPFDAWLVLRGLKTLAVRMRQHCENARAVVAFLQDHPSVTDVLYPGLPDHPGHAIAARQMRDFGGMVSFLVESEQEAVDLVARTKLWIAGREPRRCREPHRAPRPDDPRLDGRGPVRLTRATSCGCRQGSSRPTISSRISRRRWRRFALAPRSTVSLPEPIDLLHRGLTHNVGCYLVETDDGIALFDCGPTPVHPRTSRRDLPAAGSSSGTCRTCSSPTSTSTTPARPAPSCAQNPSLQVHVSAVGAPHLVEPSRLEASARRLYGDTFDALWGELVPVPAENIHVVGDVVLGLQCFPSTGHASHHVSMLHDDGTLYAGDSMGVRIAPASFVLAPDPAARHRSRGLGGDDRGDRAP